ncbi:MAG TPA: hypothetical protein DIT64_07140 [Verrucomicrobiales bacterium]|nr:hypothetical protein [Verrucomicrobiales bacterium]
MSVHQWFFLFFIIGATAQAQWQSTTYALKGGYNSIYLHGAATHATMEQLFPNSGDTANVQEVWRWNPNPTQVQFTTTPLLPTQGTPEWSVWVRGGGANTLPNLTGPAAYLVKCAGTSSNTYNVPIVHKPAPPSSTWVRNGANFLGFPSRLNGNYPFFSTYFATFPAAIATNSKIYKYVGGDLSASNPIQVFSPSAERLDRNQAYWFESEVVGNFYAPVHVTLSLTGGLDFGRNGSIVTARVLNRTASVMTLTIAPVASNAAPAGQEAITGPVPLTRRTFNTGTAAWEETPIATAYNEVIAPQSAVELSFGIDRVAMGGTADALFASMLRLTDAANLFDILIPATARKTSLAGLWIGEARVTAVESKAQADAITPASRPFPLRYLLHVADNGTARVLSQVFLGQLAAAPHDFGICTKEAGLKADAKDKAARIVATHMPLDRVLTTGTGSVAIPGTLTRTITVPFDDPVNPFVHQYHPDHDNKSPTGAALIAGKESHAVTREVTFTFTTAPPEGSTATGGWGSAVIGGTYAEVIHGLHKDSAGVGTGDGLHLTGVFELRRVSELGAISVTP